MLASCFAFADKTVECEEATAVYMIFDQAPESLTVNGKAIENPYFLHQYVEIEPATKIVIEGADPKEVHTFKKENVPSWVQKWEAPCEKADLLLISSHADDEQLFFAGILPYYTQVKDYEVQVAYATNHANEIGRHHERLNGLWECGVRHYPVSSGYADLYSESYEQALANLAPYGISEEDIVNWEKSLLSEFEPQIVVTHDVNGEYGHGMHKLVNGTVRKVLENAEKDFPFLKKVYFHLYDENQIVLGWMDEIYDELGGLTPFQVTQQKGFEAHQSQHWTWFKGWIHGKNNEITKASQIGTYNPAYYGCYYSSVGPDHAKNDFFENVMSYEEQRIAAEEKAKEEAAEKQRQFEEEARAKELEKAKKQKTIIIAATSAVIIASIIVIIIRSSLRKKEKAGKHAKH